MTQMKMRTKITSGFVLMMVLLAVVSIVAVLFLSSASTDFIQYRDWATDSNLMSDLQENMLMVRMNVKDFLIRGNEQDKKEFAEYLKNTKTLIATAHENIKNVQRVQLVQKIDGALMEYENAFTRVTELQARRDDLVTNSLDVKGPAMEQKLTDILVSARQDNDMESAYFSALSLRNLLLARLYAFKFLDSNTKDNEARVLEELDNFRSNLAELDRRLENVERRALLKDVMNGLSIYSDTFTEVAQVLYERNDITTNTLDVVGPEIADTGKKIVSLIVADQDVLGPKLQKANQTAIMIAMIVSGAALVLGIFLTIFITGSILKQLGADPAEIEKIASRIAEGDLNIDISDENIRGVYQSVKEMVDALRYKADIVEQIANKDLSVRIEMASDKDQLGRSLNIMKDSLNKLLGQVNNAVEQVANGSDQVSQASQNLSQGATEQASSLEEVTSSANEINSQAKQNAENAGEAHSIARQATDDAQSGKSKMDQLLEIMERINASSDEINKVVKVIDDIAFQINLLALNANVEAARAGKYGKGFAVVADEVRNLAVKSADSVKETTNMVNETVDNIRKGMNATGETAKQLESIVDGSGKVANFLEEIAQASREQAQAIEQITEGLDQIDEATQSNTASAEESASASEELAGQAQQLRSMVAQFTLENNRDSYRQLRTQSSAPRRKLNALPYGGETTGKQKVAAAVKKPETSWDEGENGHGEETGIRPVSPEEKIRLDDDDFDRF